MALSTCIREHLRSNIVGYLALFVAMSGASYAASIASDDIQRNAIRSKHIKAANVQNSDIAPDAIDSSKVADGSLAGADIDESSLDFSVVQSRVAGSCAAGESIRAISQSGQVTCEADDAGSGTASDLVAGGSVVSDSEVDNNLTISGGSVTDGSLSPNVALLNRAGQTFTGSNTFQQELDVAPIVPATNGVDVSDSDITNAINVGDNTLLGTTFAIDGTNFDVASTGNLTSAGQFGGPAGTVAVPTYSFSGDLNTGMFRSAADTLAIAAGGTTQATINGTTVDIADNNLTTSGAVTASSATLSSMRLTPFATAGGAGVPACGAGTRGQVYYDSDFSGAPSPDEGLVSCNGTAYVWVGDGATVAD